MASRRADEVPLTFYLPAGLFLKPDARISIQVKLPLIKVCGVSISNWEIMERIKELVKPETFTTLRVVHYSREVVDFEGDFESLRAMRKVVLLLHKKTIKLSGFSEVLQVSAKPHEPSHPTKEECEEYFKQRGVESFEDSRPGERADTVLVKGLPVKWFVTRTSDDKPCPRLLSQAFQKFGSVRKVGVVDYPSQTNTFGPNSMSHHFDCYVQYEKYVSFVNAMSSLKSMKLLRLEGAVKESTIPITVDFDRGAYLSDRNIRKRQREEERRKKEAEEQARKELEEKQQIELLKEAEKNREEEEKLARKTKKLEEKRKKKEQKSMLIAHLKEMAVQRRKEAQRLLSVLLATAAEARYEHVGGQLITLVVWKLVPHMSNIGGVQLVCTP